MAEPALLQIAALHLSLQQQQAGKFQNKTAVFMGVIFIAFYPHGPLHAGGI